jgi:type VI secretion system protein ImpE
MSLELAERAVREGDLETALRQLQEQVRARPAEVDLRVFLFQLLCVLGQWERASTQLSVAGKLDAKTLAMVQTYREALRCEVLRTEVFAGRKSPVVFGEPERWVALLVEALQSGQAAQARALRAEAFEEAPASAGSIDGEPFEWIADADMRLGPVCEVVVNGRYYWIPFARLSSVELETPADLRDFVWMPARFQLANGGELVGLIPTRYPGSQDSEDAQIQLARKTVWSEEAQDLFVGLGQRILATDRGEHALLDARSIVIGPPPRRDESDDG